MDFASEINQLKRRVAQLEGQDQPQNNDSFFNIGADLARPYAAQALHMAETAPLSPGLEKVRNMANTPDNRAAAERMGNLFMNKAMNKAGGRKKTKKSRKGHRTATLRKPAM